MYFIMMVCLMHLKERLQGQSSGNLLNAVIISGNGANVDVAFDDPALIGADGSIRSVNICVTGFTTDGAG